MFKLELSNEQAKILLAVLEQTKTYSIKSYADVIMTPLRHALAVHVDEANADPLGDWHGRNE